MKRRVIVWGLRWRTEKLRFESRWRRRIQKVTREGASPWISVRRRLG
jgi:hypothetical protein